MAAAKRILTLERRVEELETKVKELVRVEAKRRQRYAKRERDRQRLHAIIYGASQDECPNGGGD